MADWTFDAIECDATGLPILVAGLGSEWAGFAVTMPGKQAAAEFAGQRTARVDVLGVANTLIRRRGGWLADNTDVDGVRASLVAAGIEPGGPVLVVGGGGTARAVVAALAEMRWRGPLFLAGRTPGSCVILGEIAAGLGLEVRHIGMSADEIHAIAADLALAVATVPAGAADHLAGALASIPALFDVIYDPWPSPLIAAGAEGRITVTGLDMLLHQALTQFELITGVPAPAIELRQALRAAVGSPLPLPI